MTVFDLFIGVDWSGAIEEGLKDRKGIQVAEAECDSTAAPKLVPPPNNEYWSRKAVLKHLEKRAKKHCVLAGIDFAFALPFFAYPFGKEGYFPGSGCSPPNAPSLWEKVDGFHSGKDDDFYGSGILKDDEFKPYFNELGKNG